MSFLLYVHVCATDSFDGQLASRRNFDTQAEFFEFQDLMISPECWRRPSDSQIQEAKLLCDAVTCICRGHEALYAFPAKVATTLSAGVQHFGLVGK